MSKVKIKIDKSPETDVVEKKVEAEVIATPVSVKSEWPEITATGRFTSVPFAAGYVVYNPIGQRVTEVVSKVAADDIVRQQNAAAQIKG